MLSQQIYHDRSSFVGRHLTSQLSQHFLIFSKHSFACRLPWHNLIQFVGYSVYRKLIGEHLWNHLLIGHQVDKRNIVNLQHVIEGKTNQFWQGSFIAHHLRNIKQGCLERGSSTGYKSRRSVRQELVSLILHHSDRSTFQEFIVIFILYRRSTSQHHLIIFKTFSHLYHGRKIVLNFL